MVIVAINLRLSTAGVNSKLFLPASRYVVQQALRTSAIMHTKLLTHTLIPADNAMILRLNATSSVIPVTVVMRS